MYHVFCAFCNIHVCYTKEGKNKQNTIWKKKNQLRHVMFYLKQSGFNIDCVERKYMYIQNKRTHTWFKLYVLSIRLMTKTKWNSSSVQRTHCVGTCFVTFFVLLLKTFTSSDNPSILYVLSVIVYHPIYVQVHSRTPRV